MNPKVALQAQCKGDLGHYWQIHVDQAGIGNPNHVTRFNFASLFFCGRFRGGGGVLVLLIAWPRIANGITLPLFFTPTQV